ncbi:MAG: Gfo/Idh/MocA family oxidoreductase [Lentisphaerae bacterium]|jgi:predicted dehydrogenase|nr:Gfo/Idh/MocA family oxidoreductase [Lentisphaerota bacterium]MBT4818677.1 Gfo/Idh/MocA family oxidoreductase [Lentisphaerota bacterium]MBT5610884.1 Gfo/Idh/MocA family oxidoreductase [Lentisphaerota bacterium]MBT7060651.1 Gfo/Idh/MocA family oxidoreductase [Lentisphaerota bacterium]MBT7846724.1 Gfo/Idh/MocA family oxidoreductase [Lentisphaerota bacterium]
MDQLRLGIVGCGLRVCHHGGCVFRDCQDSARIVGMCDPVAEKRVRAGKMYSEEFRYEIPVFPSLREMAEATGVEAVYVATPNDTHCEAVLEAFDLGLHVLCEKPMDITLAKCDRMIAAAETSGRILGLGMQMHYRERYHKVRELIAEGTIGEPGMVWCTEYRPPFKQEKDWVWQSWHSGGAIVEKNCHHYDILDLWVGSEPTTVYASGNILKLHTGGGVESDIVDNAWIINDYASGARAMVGICFLAGWDQGHYREFGVHGTRGSVTFSSKDGEILHVQTENGERTEYAIDHDLRGGIYRDFVECACTGRQPLVTGERGRRSLLVPIAAELSILEKRPVSVTEL